MNSKTILTMVVALVAMIGLTGIGTAMDTNVQYNGDGSYYCNYDAYGTGSIGIHTYTSDGSDHLLSGWENSEAHGYQVMDTYSGTAFNTDYSGTVISRVATVGEAAVGGFEAGYIQTITTDNEGNVIVSYADYRDNEGYGSHVTTEQTVVIGSLVDILDSQYTVTGVVAETQISGFSYGSNTTVSGMVMTATGDEYTYVLLQMDNGRMDLYVLSAAASVDPTITVPRWLPYIFPQVRGLNLIAGEEINGACGQIVDVKAKGVGIFAVGAGTDMHGAEFDMTDNLGTVYYGTDGLNVTVDMTTDFQDKFTATGYIYAVNMTAPAP